MFVQVKVEVQAETDIEDGEVESEDEDNKVGGRTTPFKVSVGQLRLLHKCITPKIKNLIFSPLLVPFFRCVLG